MLISALAGLIRPGAEVSQEAGKLVEEEKGSPDSSLRSTNWLGPGFMTSGVRAE